MVQAARRGPTVPGGFRGAVGLGLALLALAGRAHGTTLFGLVNTGEIYASTDQGASWSVRATLPVHDAVEISAATTSSQLLLAGASGSIYGSSNGGVTWSGTGAAPATDVVDLLIRPDASVVLLTASGSIYLSTDLGHSFSGLSALDGSNFVSLALNADATVNLYALTATGEVYLSTDGGATWAGKGAMPVSNAVRLLGQSSTLYALTATGDLYASADDGATWIGAGTLSQVGTTSLTRDGATLLAATGAGEVAASTDALHWTWRGTINQVTVRSLGVDTPMASGVGNPARGADLSSARLWPNPVTPGRALAFDLRMSAPGDLRLAVFDAAGREVAERPPQALESGEQRLEWNPGLRVPGTYFVRLSTGGGAARGLHLVSLP